MVAYGIVTLLRKQSGHLGVVAQVPQIPSLARLEVWLMFSYSLLHSAAPDTK